jgi:hypothetical protein
VCLGNEYLLVRVHLSSFRIVNRNVGAKIVKKEGWLRERGTANPQDLGNHG